MLVCSPVHAFQPVEQQCAGTAIMLRQQSSSSVESVCSRAVPVLHEKLLHSGLSSQVYYGYHRGLDRKVVVKAYDLRKLSPRHLQNVEREIRSLQALRDSRVTSVVCLLEVHRNADEIALVLEPAMRGDLYQLLHNSGKRLGEEFVCKQVVVPLLEVLVQLHHMNIIHRDIKPENLLFDAVGRLLVADFGLAVDQACERPFLRMGTLDYMCPEVLRQPSPEDAEARGLRLPEGSQAPYCEKVDVWAVGVLVYELLCGRTPFEEEGVQQTAHNILAGTLAQFPSHVPQDCREFVLAALAHDPLQRPSAQQLLAHPWLQRHTSDVDCVAVVVLEGTQLTPPKQQHQEGPSNWPRPATTPEQQQLPGSRPGWCATPPPASSSATPAWKMALPSTVKRTATRSRFAS